MSLDQILSLADFENPLDISIPLRFNGEQPNVYDVDPAISKACEYGQFVGDTRRGGSVNFEQYTFIPHCNGTHTECVGHITDDRVFVKDCLNDAFGGAILVTIAPENAINSDDTYPFALAEEDLFISAKLLTRAIDTCSNKISPAENISLIIRTLPNNGSKLDARYNKVPPPFFSNEAMTFVRDHFKHLLVDLPSIDRIYDGGKLSNHRIFWNVGAGGKAITAVTRVASTITELIYVPNEIKDGEYLLNLQIAAFEADATPSRPVLFKQR